MKPIIDSNLVIVFFSPIPLGLEEIIILVTKALKIVELIKNIVDMGSAYTLKICNLQIFKIYAMYVNFLLIR